MPELRTSQPPHPVTVAVRTRRASTGCRFALSLIVASSVSALAIPLAAQPASTSARAYLSVEDTNRCVTMKAVQAQVQARSRRIAFVLESSDVPKLQVTVRRDAGRAYAVTLAVTSPDGRRSQRRFAAGSCVEAEATVAFLIALTLDPTAFSEPSAVGDPRFSADTADRALDLSTTPPAPDTEAAADSPPSAATAPDANGLGAAPRDTNQSKPASVPPSSELPPDPGAEGGANFGARGFFDIEKGGVSLAAHLTSGVAPAAMYGLGLRVLMAFRGRGLWAPALQLEAAHGWLSERAQPGGTAAFRRTTARLDVCMLGLRGAGLAAHACLNGALGSLWAKGSDSYLPRTRVRFWGDLGAGLRLTADLGPLLFEAGTALTVPLRRDRFAFSPDVFHRVAALCWDAHLGMGVRFP